jgi:hypothetical protein
MMSKFKVTEVQSTNQLYYSLKYATSNSVSVHRDLPRKKY